MNGSQPGTDIDNGDSRKRPLDRESDSGITKRSNPGNYYDLASDLAWFQFCEMFTYFYLEI